MKSEAAGKKRIMAVKGTKDILPTEVGKWQEIEAIARRIFELYGYREIRTPIIEGTELFEKGTGVTSDIVIKEMYTFKDKAGRSLTLRPEYTPSVVRAITEHSLHLKPQPMRFYYFGPMFRYDKPQKGRYRQFHQIDIEVFGEKDPACDAEIIEMADYLLNEMKVKRTEILVNSVGCRKCRHAYSKDLRAIAGSAKERFCPDCQRKILTNPLRIFDCKQEACRAEAEKFPIILDYLCEECRSHFTALLSYLEFYNIKYKIEPKLVRGIDYYTRTTFEIISSSLGAQNSILGGGRYDDLMMDYGGPDICGIGFAMGMERLLSVANLKQEKSRFLYIAYMGEEAKKKAMESARFLRQSGVECLVEWKNRSLGNQLSRANKLGASWVGIIGEDELKDNKLKLKDMAAGTQIKADLEEVLKLLRPSALNLRMNSPHER